MHHRLVRCTLAEDLSGIRVDEEAFGRLGEAPGELKCPNGVAIRGDMLYVVEIGNTRLQSLRLPQGEWLSTIGTYGRPDDGAGCLRAPCDVAVHGRALYVTDTANNRVVAYIEAGDRAARSEAAPHALFETSWFGTRGDGPGEFYGPSGIAVSPNGGELYVADRYNHRVQCFSAGGELRRILGSGRRSTEAVTADGHTYERAAISQWLRQHDTSPMSGEPLVHKRLSPDGCAHQRREALKYEEGEVSAS